MPVNTGISLLSAYKGDYWTTLRSVRNDSAILPIVIERI